MRRYIVIWNTVPVRRLSDGTLRMVGSRSVKDRNVRTEAATSFQEAKQARAAIARHGRINDWTREDDHLRAAFAIVAVEV